jgi:hypothetical protein
MILLWKKNRIWVGTKAKGLICLPEKLLKNKY